MRFSARSRSIARFALLVPVLIVFAMPANAAAQQSDDEWLEDCQDNDRDNRRVVFCDVRVETMRAVAGALRVDAGQNGGVIVRGDNRSDIEVHARIQARARNSSTASALAEDVRIELGRSTISADAPDTDDDESVSVTFVVYVPADSDLELVAHNGPVSVADVNGQIDARTHNGPLSLSGVSGDVVARTQNGPLNVALSGRRWTGGTLDAETHNGPVNLTIPEGYSADLETGTVNGPLNTDIPLTITQFGRMRDRRIETKLGNGGPAVRAVTTNGPVNIRSR
jgi:DUF4097 and DUF4098 domain-containing protein YvlB